jgi:hypothetical protein
MSQPGSITDFPFKNNVPDPLLSGKELPTFKFALEQSEGKVMGGSCLHRAAGRPRTTRRQVACWIAGGQSIPLKQRLSDRVEPAHGPL